VNFDRIETTDRHHLLHAMPMAAAGGLACARDIVDISAKWRSCPEPAVSSSSHTTKRRFWERNADGGFPDARTIKQRARDRLDPGRDLGHIDRPARRRVSV
jgi:predicted Rdx family selenoprotein